MKTFPSVYRWTEIGAGIETTCSGQTFLIEISTTMGFRRRIKDHKCDNQRYGLKFSTAVAKNSKSQIPNPDSHKR